MQAVSFKCMHAMFCHALTFSNCMLIAIIIGFTNTSYIVNETVGVLQVNVQVFSSPDDQPLLTTANLVIQTMSGLASKCIIKFNVSNGMDVVHLIISWRK